MPKDFGFSVLVFIAVFLVSGFRFSVFVGSYLRKLLAVFRFCYAIWFLGFPILSYLWFSVLTEFLCGFATSFPGLFSAEESMGGKRPWHRPIT